MRHGPADRTLPPKPDVPNTSWWTEPEAQSDRQTFYQQQHERQGKPWGQHGTLTLSSYGPYDLPRRKLSE